MSAMIDRILGAAYLENKVASLVSLKKVIQEKDEFKGLSKEKRKEIFDILGKAHLAFLKLEEASRYFRQNSDIDQLKTVFELAIRHGKYGLVKDLTAYGRERGYSALTLSEKDYLEFLRMKALPYVPLHRDPENGFSIDENILDEILREIGEPKEKALARTVEMMEKAGSLNFVKKFILAYYSGNPSLIQRCEDEFNSRASGGRQDIGSALKEYCKAHGLEFQKTLQLGDNDNCFPSVAHVFLVKKQGQPLVLKENLRLHQDYSRLSGYSMEKEILEILRHENIVKYSGSVKIKEMEFLILEFMPGVTLEKYVRPNNLLPADRAVMIVRDLARSIGYLHENNIISMDIKDKNVMYDGRKITIFDFGISQIVQGTELTDETFITSLLTTPEYVAPEMALQFRAYPGTDIFQLGVLFYKLLVGKNPFVKYELYDFMEGDECRESEIIKFVLPALYNDFDKTPKILQANPEITKLLEAMLKKDFKGRLGTKEAAAALEKILRGGL